MICGQRIDYCTLACLYPPEAEVHKTIKQDQDRITKSQAHAPEVRTGAGRTVDRQGRPENSRYYLIES